jgi:hypothetical protein
MIAAADAFTLTGAILAVVLQPFDAAADTALVEFMAT